LKIEHNPYAYIDLSELSEECRKEWEERIAGWRKTTIEIFKETEEWAKEKGIQNYGYERKIELLKKRAEEDTQRMKDLNDEHV